MIVVKQRKILESPVEPKDKNWLWLSSKEGHAGLYVYRQGKWMPFSGGSVKDELSCEYDELTKTLIIE